MSLASDHHKGRFLPGSSIEIRNENLRRGRIHSALFDFDGTISLIREGWQQVMLPMMVELLSRAPGAEDEHTIATVVTDFVDRLTGEQTIYQMIELCKQLKKRGVEPLEPLAYKREYHDRLWRRIQHRVAGLKAGQIPREDILVAGSRELLVNLREREVTLYLASGTDIPYVRDEVEALGLTEIFDGGIYGAIDKWENYSKQMVIDGIIRDHSLRGEELVVFGDGFVEIENAKGVGGIAVGVATDEVRREGVNDWKRNRLIQAGADIIIPEFRQQERLIRYLFSED